MESSGTKRVSKNCLRHGLAVLTTGMVLLLALQGCGSGSNPAEQRDGGSDRDVITVDTGRGEAGPGDAGSSDDGGDRDAAQTKEFEGVYEVSGSDGMWGSFQGQAEIRWDQGEGAYHMIRLISYDQARFEADWQVASAWTATMDPGNGDEDQGSLTVQLNRVGFVLHYGDQERSPEDATPLSLSAVYGRQGPRDLEVTWTSPDATIHLDGTETWHWTGPNGADPIWQNERVLLAAHDPISPSRRNELFQLYSSYHDMPEVQPYVDRPEFQEAMHYFVFDPTDYDFYQANPHRLRVIQGVPDTIALAEARVRALAYGKSLADKQAYFEQRMPVYHLNDAGMLTYYAPQAQPPYDKPASGDSMLWTGVYAASQAMRYLVTSDQEALDNMIRAVEGQILCHDIVGDPGMFARTIRTHVDDGNPNWVQGTGPYAQWDWMPRCNNDMLKGYFTAFPWAYLALQAAGGHGDLVDRMTSLLEDLADNNPDCQDVQSINRLLVHMSLALLTGSITERLTYQGLFEGWRTWVRDHGGSTTYEYGTSDWSGNHLNLQSLLSMERIADELGDGATRDDVKEGMKTALETMRSTRLGLFQLVMGTLGAFPTQPPEVQDAIWVLREFPAPKVCLDFDWRINPSFCMSPFPDLPWKNDWTTSDRFRSLVAYPLFERPKGDVFAWKSSPFDFREQCSNVEAPGADYLFAYWFGRLVGVITPDL